jgi:hypothetical protein
VSDLLSRLAARAVGEAPRAQPRIATPDDFGVMVPDAAREAVAEAPAARATPVAPAVRSEAAETRVTSPRAPEPRVTRPPAQRPASAAQSTAAAERTAQIAEEGPVEAPSPPEPVAERVEPQAAPARAKTVPTLPAVPAAPAVSAPLVRRMVSTRVERVHTVASVSADEPPVHVHIGRLEVRANLEQPAPQPSRRESVRPEEGPSLADYLRGRQTA